MSISHEDIKNVYFVGAGGIGMSALERYFNSRGISVAGYDRTPTRLTETLQAEGIDIVFDDDDALIPERFRNPADTLVVFTPAVPESHRGLSWFRRNGFTVMKRSEVLGLITAPTKSICFSGTHGKRPRRRWRPTPSPLREQALTPFSAECSATMDRTFF